MRLTGKLKVLKGVFIRYRIVIAIFFISLVLQWIFIFLSDFIVNYILKINLAVQDLSTLKVGDYTVQLKNLVETGSLITPEGKVLNKYPPIYPYFLYFILRLSYFTGVSFTNLFLFVSTIVISITSLGIYSFTKKMTDYPDAAIISALVFITHPYILQGLVKAMSETLFNLFFIFSAITFYNLTLSKDKNISNFVLCGLMTGLAMLTRPIALFLPLVYLLIIYFIRKSVNIPRMGIPVFIFILILTLLPWELFNYYNTNKLIPLATSSSASFQDGINFNHHPVKEKIKLPENVVLLTDELLELNPEEDKYFSKVLNIFVHKPYATVRLFSIKSIRSWYGVMEQNRKKEIIKLIIFIIYILPCFVIILRKSEKIEIKIFNRFFLTITIYFWLMTIAVVSMARYMIPVFLLANIYYSFFFERFFIREKAEFNF